MNLRLLDVCVKIVRIPGTEKAPEAPAGAYLLLADKNGVLLKSADGYYFAVKKEGITTWKNTSYRKLLVK